MFAELSDYFYRMNIDWIYILNQILKLLGVFSIPSLIWNIFQYRKNNKFKKWESERELEKLKIEKEELDKPSKLVEYILNTFANQTDPAKPKDLSEPLQSIFKKEEDKKHGALRRIEIEEKYHKKILDN
jgi:hypothetical protein